MASGTGENMKGISNMDKGRHADNRYNNQYYIQGSHNKNERNVSGRKERDEKKNIVEVLDFDSEMHSPHDQ